MSSSPSPSLPKERAILSDCFNDIEIIRELGRGGMGVVYLVKNHGIGGLQALKILKPDLAEVEKHRTNFSEEAKILGKFNTKWECVVTAMGTGEYNGLPFILTEYLRFGSIKDYVDTKGKLSMSAGLKLAQGITFSLIELNQIDLLHRDIKPSNVMLRERGWVALNDFGLAISRDKLLPTKIITGTPAYMSPEQWLCQDLDIRSDIYSLGASLYYMLAGDTPHGGDRLAILTAHQNQSVPDIREINPDINNSIAEFLLKCMAHLPENRFQSPNEVMSEIKRIWRIEESLSYERGRDEIQEYTTSFNPFAGNSNFDNTTRSMQ